MQDYAPIMLSLPVQAAELCDPVRGGQYAYILHSIRWNSSLAILMSLALRSSSHYLTASNCLTKGAVLT